MSLHKIVIFNRSPESHCKIYNYIPVRQEFIWLNKVN